MISVIVPAYNEERAIRRVIREIKSVRIPKEIIVVDDGSSDNTYAILRGMRGIRTLRHLENRGKGTALRTGMRNAKHDIIVTLDADCTYPASAIPKLVKELKTADVAIGSRLLGKEARMSRFHYFGNRMFSVIISVLTVSGITDAASGMRAFKRGILKDLNMKARGLNWEVEMTTKSLIMGYRVKEVPITYRRRIGKAKLRPFHDGFMFSLTIIGSLLYGAVHRIMHQ